MEEIFDAISYSKGSCVIRMLHDWIGTEVRVQLHVAAAADPMACYDDDCF